MANTDTNTALNDVAALVRMVASDPKRITDLIESLQKAAAEHADKLGAYDTLAKARSYLSTAEGREQAAKSILDGADGRASQIVSEASDRAANIIRDAEKNFESSRRLQSEAQALKDLAVREHEAREKALLQLKADLDARQSNLNRREEQIVERENAMAEKQRKLEQAMAG